MTEHHVTFVRDSDRTRVVFVFHGLDCSKAEAIDKATALAPIKFRWAAHKLHDGGTIHIPEDGDDYGASGVPVYESQTVAPWSQAA